MGVSVVVAEQAPVLVVDDNQESQFVLRQVVEQYGFRAVGAYSGPEAIALAAEETPIAVVLDVVMPGMSGFQVIRAFKSREQLRYIPIILVTAKDTVDDIVEGFEAGADDYLVKPYEPLELMARLRAAVHLRQLMRELNLEQERNRWLVSELSERYDFRHIVGVSAQIKEVLSLLEKVVDAPVPVLISGPSGTGKELVARALHFQSQRRHSPFVVKNCAGLHGELAESELFGYERGSFTGAYRDRKGLFEAAHGGTLFLDEIGEMPLPVQAKLLRVLQEGTLLPVGAVEEKKVDVRFVAATNRDLMKMVDQGLFREDLFYRIHVINIKLPPLEDRKVDIPILAEHFLKVLAGRRGGPIPKLASQVVQAFKLYSWRGNVRELQNEIERMLILGSGREELGVDLLSSHLIEKLAGVENTEYGHAGFDLEKMVLDSESADCAVEQGAVEQGAVEQVGKLKYAMAMLEKRMISDALNKCADNRSQAAVFLGISRSNLINKIKEYNLGSE